MGNGGFVLFLGDDFGGMMDEMRWDGDRWVAMICISCSLENME